MIIISPNEQTFNMTSSVLKNLTGIFPSIYRINKLCLTSLVSQDFYIQYFKISGHWGKCYSDITSQTGILWSHKITNCQQGSNNKALAGCNEPIKTRCIRGFKLQVKFNLNLSSSMIIALFRDSY